MVGVNDEGPPSGLTRYAEGHETIVQESRLEDEPCVYVRGGFDDTWMLLSIEQARIVIAGLQAFLREEAS